MLLREGRRCAEMTILDQDGRMLSHENLEPAACPVVYFQASELLLLGRYGLFARMGRANQLSI